MSLSAAKYVAEENGETDFSNLYIRFPKIWEDYIDVSWARQVFDGRKVIKYQLAATAKNYRVERYFAPNETVFRLQGLIPLMTVDIQVRALVELVGRGPIWDPWATSQAVTTDSTVVAVASVSSEFLHGRVVWGSELLRSGPSQTHVAVAAAKYQIKVREKGKFLTSDLCEKEVPITDAEFKINEVPLNSVFEVTARAVSIFGDIGRWSTPTRFLTLCPVDVNLPEIGENYAIIKWSREGKDFLDSESAIDELVIMVDLLPSQRELDVDSQAKQIQIAAQSFSNEIRLYRLKHLMPGRNYSIRSRYRNSLGDWTNWSVKQFSTLCPVAMPDVQMVGHNFIHISWQRAEPEAGGGTFEDQSRNVKSWEIRCTVGKAQTTMALAAKERETKMVSLRPGVDYEIDVRALTDANEWGPWSLPVVVTTLHRLLPRAENCGERWIKVNWERREKRHLDNITRYHVQVNAVNNPFRVAKYFPADVTSYTFDGLKPGTAFHIVVQAFSDQRWGPWSDPTEASTLAPCVPQLIRRGEDFIQLKWVSEYADPQDQRYQVRVRRPPNSDTGSGEQSVAPTSLIEEEVSTNVFRASRLPSFSRVTIQIRCFDHALQAWNDWGPEREFRTLPVAMVLLHTGETSLELSWSRCPRIVSAITDLDYDEGVVDALYPDNPSKYIIRLNNVGVDGQHTEQCKFHFNSSQPTTYTITELQPDTQYSVQMSYMDASQMWSPQSATLSFRTAPSLQIWVLDVTEGSCKLQWGRWSQASHVSTLEERTFKIVVEKVLTEPEDVPLQYSVQDSTVYTVEDLMPSTLYRVQIAAAAKAGSVWGVWSNPTYIFTTPSMEMELTQVGEDYATIQWFRGTLEASLAVLYNAKLVVVSSSSNSKATRPPATPPPSEGHHVFTGDSTAIEYHVQLYKITPPANADDQEALPIREIFFESKLNANQTSVRIPSLTASTQYETVLCACTSNKQWGCWSPPMAFSTSTATEVRISEITQDHITVEWGNTLGDATDVWKYQMKIQGHDDDLYKEVELESHVSSYDIKGLSISCCYSVSLRRFLQSDKNWGQWCVPVFIAVKVVPVEMVEISQDWTLVRWPNKAPPDKNIKKMQFLSLLGGNVATVVTLNADVKQHTFTELSPNQLYTAHQLVIEQSTSYQKPMLLPEKTTGARKVELDHSVAPFSIPVVATEFAVFLNDGAVFRTHRPLILSLDRIGQNFALLRWEMKGASQDDESSDSLTNSRFEVEVSELDTENDEKRYVKATGDRVIIRQLKPDSNVRFCVRAIADKSDATCKWSNACVTQMLPMIEPQLGAGDGTETPGIGEDYLMVFWKKSLRNSNIAGMSGVSFEARITLLDGDEREERVIETQHQRYHFADLVSDTKYQIEVRTLIALSAAAGLGVDESIKGEWSKPITCTTLSPMAVAVVDIVEVGANIHWRRKKCTANSKTWWVDVDSNVLRNEIMTISSFHVRIVNGETNGIVFDEQFAETHEQFANCKARLKALTPGTSYTVSVRASTGMLWGAWSEPILFRTCVACSVGIDMIGENFVVAQWKREETETTAEHLLDVTTAGVAQWELSFSVLSSDKPVQTVIVDHDKTHNCVGGLLSNTPHTLMVRPIYNNAETGQWSIPTYFVTMAPLKVEVGKVGETFVQVSWERARQETVHSKLKGKHIEAMRDMEMQLKDLEAQLNLCAAEAAPISARDLMADDPEDDQAAAVVAPKQHDAVNGNRKLVQDQIDQLQKKIANRQKLSQLQAVDLDQNTVYPKGEDSKFELFLYGGAADGEEQPLIRKRTMGKGEVLCRLENLNPKTIYEVKVRALFTNHFPMENIATTNIGDVDETEGANNMPWGPWSDKTRFATLKPIVAKAKSIGSECIAVEWDTGGIGEDAASRAGAQRTAITKFQIQVKEDPKQKQDKQRDDKQRPVITLDDSSLKGYVVGGLTPNSVYSVTIRVCYEGDKWGVWSQPVNFITMPKLLARLQSVAERQMEFLVWRDQQAAVTDASIVVWKPLFTDHQLAINGFSCAQAFSLEANTSTLLTLDTLAVDTEYTISVKDRVEEYWQDYKSVLKCETLPFPPHRATLLERKGVNVVITWAHRQNLGRQYLYMVELAVQDDVPKKQMSNSALKRSNLLNGGPVQAAPRHGNFELLGYTTAHEFRMELHYPVHHCFFRIKCCKTNQTTDGEPLTLTVNTVSPQAIVVEDPMRYVWSRPSHTAHFKTPSVPDHPTGLHVAELTHCSAILRWQKPQNYADHSGVKYRVYLNNSYQEKFTCICETASTMCELKDLVTNCHYRVSVTAESTMGTSQSNNTLHFSTRVTPNGSVPNKKMDKPLTSTLPPRAALHAPQEILDARRDPQNGAGKEAFVALLDDSASTVFSAVKLTQQRRSPPRPGSGSAQRHRTLPPIDPQNQTI